MITGDDDSKQREARMSLSSNEISHILDVLANSDWNEATVTIGDVTIAVARNGAHVPPTGSTPKGSAVPDPLPIVSAAPASVPSIVPALVTLSGNEVEVEAPSVGVFWRAPVPGAVPFVEVGERVEAGAEMCIIEVNELMSRVSAPVSGTVLAVHVDNGDAVEFGMVLFSIEPE